MAAVTRGERLAAVGWLQSHINAEQRELLFDLERARRALHECGVAPEESAALARCTGTLLRMWAQA